MKAFVLVEVEEELELEDEEDDVTVLDGLLEELVLTELELDELTVLELEEDEETEDEELLVVQEVKPKTAAPINAIKIDFFMHLSFPKINKKK